MYDEDIQNALSEKFKRRNPPSDNDQMMANKNKGGNMYKRVATDNEMMDYNNFGSKQKGNLNLLTLHLFVSIDIQSRNSSGEKPKRKQDKDSYDDDEEYFNP